MSRTGKDQGSAHFPVQGQISNILGFADDIVSVTTTHLGPCITKTATDIMEMNRCGHIPIYSCH